MAPARPAALLSVADRLRNGLRSLDLVGGELPEGFCICFPEALTAQAHAAAERLQRLLEATPHPTPLGPLALRCSLGLAVGQGPGSSAEALMVRARAALAAAQEAGGEPHHHGPVMLGVRPAAAHRPDPRTRAG